MARDIAEGTNRLSVFFLKKQGYLPQGELLRYGGIRWTRGDWENNINFNVKTSGDEYETKETSYIELIYTVTIRWSGEKIDMRYKVPLVSTPCNYGGKRYWFICELSKNGAYCGRRIGVIYSVDRWFGCRYCGDIAYQAQFEGGNFRVGSVTDPDVEKALEEVKREYYNGKPTKRYERYLRLKEKMDNSWIRAAKRLGVKF
ncbi:MAG: hypothetical protein Q8Q96_01550 [bacterium]|nr:hypothetical protein [bacterium]